MSDVTVVLRMDESDADRMRGTDEVRVVLVDHDGAEGVDLPARVHRVGSLPDGKSTATLRCPRCNSPSPSMHPAVQYEGEVEPCLDPWHKSVR